MPLIAALQLNPVVVYPALFAILIWNQSSNLSLQNYLTAQTANLYDTGISKYLFKVPDVTAGVLQDTEASFCSSV